MMNLEGVRLDLSIHADVGLADAYKGLFRASGRIAEGFRKLAMDMAESRVRAARGIRNGERRHKATKTRRDVLRRLRKMEIEQRGWK